MFLGRRRLPRSLSAFELEAFFTFVAAARLAIEQRRQPALRLGLALHMGFLRITGRPLGVVAAIPPGNVLPPNTRQPIAQRAKTHGAAPRSHPESRAPHGRVLGVSREAKTA